METNNNLKDLLPLSVGDKHIINDSYVNQFQVAHRDQQDVTKIGKEVYEYEVFLDGLDKLPEIELQEIPKPPANQLAFIATIQESFELGDIDVSIQVETNADSYDGDIVNESIAHYNRALDTITPLEVGDTEIVFTATKGEETQEFRFPIKVVDETLGGSGMIELESQETPDSHSGEPNFTDEELELLVMDRYVYEQYKYFSGELMEMMQPSDENFGWNAYEGAVDNLYPTMRKDIELAKQKDPAPKLRAMAMDYNVDSFKEMVLHIKRINENMGIPIMIDWFEEAPTLVAETEQQTNMVEMVNQILPSFFMYPYTIQEYLFSLMLNSLGGRGFGGWYQMIEVVEHYVIDTYEDCVWFEQNLANTPLSKIEKHQYVQHTASTPAYKKLDDTQKRECASFLLAQALMSLNMNPNTKKTKEQILAEIK